MKDERCAFLLQFFDYVPLEDGVDEDDAPDRWGWPSEEPEISSLLRSTLLETGFLQNTEYECLCINFAIVEDCDPEHQVSYENVKRERTLSVQKTFHGEEISRKLSADYKGFVLSNAAEILQQVCKKFKLNSAPVDRLVQQLDGQGVGECQSEDLAIEEVEYEHEVRLNVKVPGSEFGTPESLDRNTILMLAISDLVESRGLGRFDGAEVGGAFEIFFFEGPDGQLIGELLKENLPSLPDGSYIEIETDDGVSRIDL